MKKIYSRLLLSACTFAALAFTACEDSADNDIQVVGPQSQGAYFPQNSPLDYGVWPESSEITLSILRTDKSQAQTVALNTTDESGLFNVPSSVSFAAGEAETSFKITFDGAKLEPIDYNLIVAVEKNDAFLYGMNQYEFTVGLYDEYRWLQVGTGTYSYDVFFGGEDPGLSLYQHVEKKGGKTRYKITDWGFGVDFYFTMDDNYEVMVADQFTGYSHPSYGDVYVDDMVDYSSSYDYGSSFYEDGVFYFNVVYYVSAGIFGYGYETFVLDEPLKAKSRAEPQQTVKSAFNPMWKNIDSRQLKLYDSNSLFRIK